MQCDIGSEEVPAHLIKDLPRIMADEKIKSKMGYLAQQEHEPIVVDTYFHVIIANHTGQGGLVYPSKLEQQLRLLNKAFSMCLFNIFSLIPFMTYSYQL